MAITVHGLTPIFHCVILAHNEDSIASRAPKCGFYVLMALNASSLPFLAPNMDSDGFVTRTSLFCWGGGVESYAFLKSRFLRRFSGKFLASYISLPLQVYNAESIMHISLRIWFHKTESDAHTSPKLGFLIRFMAWIFRYVSGSITPYPLFCCPAVSITRL